MASYNTISGLKVKYLSADPANPEDGQVWYNSGTGKLRVASVVGTGTWASGGAMSTARQNGGGFGTQTAGVVVGGETPARTTATEEYDGAAWSTGGVYPASYTSIGTAGTLTAGLGFGGGSPYGNTTTAEYDGTNWTAGGSFPLSYTAMGGAGTQTAGLSVAGDAYPTSPRNSNKSFEYNGAAWTAGGDLGTGRYATMSAGTQTAAATNGGTGPAATLTEEYDGSSWTAGGTGLQPQSFGGSSLNGTQDDWMTYGTNSPNYAFTQGYNGTSWSTRPSLATGRYSSAGAGTASAALCMGGRAPAFSTATEEFTAPIGTASITTS